MSNNSLLQEVIIGLGIIALATIPIWLPYLLGKPVKGYKVGVHLGNNYVSPYLDIYFKSIL